MKRSIMDEHEKYLFDLRGYLVVRDALTKGQLSQLSSTLESKRKSGVGILGSDRIYANIGHNKKALNYFKISLKKVFKIIKQCDILNSTKTKLEGSVRDPSFGRIGIKNE